MYLTGLLRPGCGSTSAGAFHLVAVRYGAVDLARRTLKPQIPLTGNHGIPIRDEVELAQDLPLATAG